MSTILKALRRLEEEKAVAEEPRPLREQIATERHAVPARGRSSWPAAIAALVLGVASGGGAIWWLFGGGTSDESAMPVVARAPQATKPVSDPVASDASVVALPPADLPPAPVAEPDPGPPEEAFASDVELVPRPDAGSRLVDADSAAPADRSPAPGSRRPVESSSAAARARAAALAQSAAAPAPLAEAVANAAGAPAPAEVVPPSPAVAHPAPVEVTSREAAPAPVAEVPAVAAPVPAPEIAPHAAAPPAVSPPPPAPEVASRAAESPALAPPAPAPSPTPAPEPARVAPKVAKRPAAAPAAPPVEEAPKPRFEIPLAVERTQWHPLADRRIAWLRVGAAGEERRVVEGDVVEGMVVAKIEPSGVVFERDGEQIHRALGKR